MLHATPLISTIALGLLLAFALGVAAQRIHLPPLIGYLLAGIVIGPFTPGYVADQNLAAQLAEVGVVLLMFGVGLHFSLDDLLSVKAIAILGALAQIAVSLPLACALAWWLGWSLGAGLIFGLCLSVASTVVVLRVLQERHLLDSERGRISIGWLVVQDLAMVLVLVLLPPLAGLLKGDGAHLGLAAIAVPIGVTLIKISGFVAVMLLGGKKLIPAILHYVAHTGSRELFRLAVLAIALGAAFLASELFGVSLALGAFFAGMLLSESRLSQQAAQETLPLRDAFAVLFFVAAGMLFDPAVITAAPLALLATVAIIVIGKSVPAYVVVRAFGHKPATALIVTACLAQIAEFSFILANLGVSLGVLSPEARTLVIAGAIVSILLNPLLFRILDEAFRRRADASGPHTVGEAMTEAGAMADEPLAPTPLSGHVVLVGYGQVGAFVADVLAGSTPPLLIIEDDPNAVSEIRQRGITAIQGNAADPAVIAAAGLQRAYCLLVAVADAFEGGQVVQQARAINPDLLISARAHTQAEATHLQDHGADIVILGEHEVAKAMLDLVAHLAEAKAGKEVRRGPKAAPLTKAV